MVVSVGLLCVCGGGGGGEAAGAGKRGEPLTIVTVVESGPRYCRIEHMKGKI